MPTNIARYIDHTLLKPEATPLQIEQLCAEARQYQFASVCVNPSFVPLCARLLKGVNVAVCTVIGFPLGATSTTSKLAEAEDVILRGAVEVDMVIPIGWLKAGDHNYVQHDIAAIVRLAHRTNAICKVIIETTLLSDAEKVVACQLAVQAKADFVKTSTGFAGGATVADVALMRRTVGATMGVKASGGIRSLRDAEAMIAAGATRLGTSAGVQIVREVAGDATPPAAQGY